VIDAKGQLDLEKVIQLTEQLTALLAAQARAFEQHRPQAAAAGLQEIHKLSQVYAAASGVVRTQPKLIEQAPPQLRRRLLQATEAFDAVLQRQGRSLSACKTVTEGLVKAIADEVAARRSVGRAYGPNAKRPISATAITLNQRA
jgi:type VI protein secretion system component VasF